MWQMGDATADWLHERLEYTPYGELWIDWKSDLAPEDGTPFRFTGKEMDAETKLYYYGARSLDPRTSRWLSTDPAMGEYIPGAPVNDEARKRNGDLPGMGGVFNVVNMHVYHYAGNNPVKYTDPTGRNDFDTQFDTLEDRRSNAIADDLLNTRSLMGSDGIPASGPCYAMAIMGVAQTYAGKNLESAQVNGILADASLYNSQKQMAIDGPGIIRAALTELGVDTSNLDIKVEKSPNHQVVEDAFATIRGVETFYNRGGNSGHFQEGNTRGYQWDPVDGSNNRGRNWGEIRNVFIRPKTRKN